MTALEAMRTLAQLIAAKEGCRAEAHHSNATVQFRGTIGRDRKAKAFWITLEQSIFRITDVNHKQRFEGNYNDMVVFIERGIK